MPASAMFQIASKMAGWIVFVPLFYVELVLDVPLLMAAVDATTDSTGLQAAGIFFVTDTSMALLFLALRKPCLAAIGRLWPPSAEQELAKPRFLHKSVLEEPEIAIDLVHLEQHRVAGMLPRYLDLIRGSEPGLRSNRLHDAYDAISMASRRFLDDLGRLDLSPNAYARLSETARRQRLLDNLEEAVHGLARLVSAAPAGSRLDRLFTNLVEGLDAALMTLVDALEGEEDSDDRRLLVHIAGDYEALMRGIRATHVSADEGLDGDDKGWLLTVTGLVERIFWLFGALAR